MKNWVEKWISLHSPHSSHLKREKAFFHHFFFLFFSCESTEWRSKWDEVFCDPLNATGKNGNGFFGWNETRQKYIEITTLSLTSSASPQTHFGSHFSSHRTANSNSLLSIIWANLFNSYFIYSRSAGSGEFSIFIHLVLSSKVKALNFHWWCKRQTFQKSRLQRRVHSSLIKPWTFMSTMHKHSFEKNKNDAVD